jgi:hypothetical protein
LEKLENTTEKLLEQLALDIGNEQYYIVVVNELLYLHA